MVLLGGEEAAIGDADIANFGHVGRSADYRGVFAGEVVALDIVGVIAIGTIEYAVAIQRFQPPCVGGADGFVVLDLIEIFAAAQAASAITPGFIIGVFAIGIALFVVMRR